MMILSSSLRRIFRKRTNIIFMLVVPLVLNILLVSSLSQEIKYHVGIWDQDESTFSQEFITHMQQKYNVMMLTADDDINGLIVNKKLDTALVIPAGFTSELIAGEDVVALHYALDASEGARPLRMYLSSYLASVKQLALGASGNEEVFYQALADYHASIFTVEYKSFVSGVSQQEISQAVTSLGYIAFGMMFLISLSTNLILEDKLTGVYDRLLATPLKRSSYFFQHLLASFVIAVIQVMLLMSILPKVVDIYYGATVQQEFQIVVVCLAFALVCIAIGVTISRFSKNVLTASSLTALINIPMLMLGGCFWPMEIMPDYMQQIGAFMPTAWFLQAGELVLYGKGLVGASAEFMYMIGFAAILLVASFLFKAEKVT